MMAGMTLLEPGLSAAVVAARRDFRNWHPPLLVGEDPMPRLLMADWLEENDFGDVAAAIRRHSGLENEDEPIPFFDILGTRIIHSYPKRQFEITLTFSRKRKLLVIVSDIDAASTADFANDHVLAILLPVYPWPRLITSNAASGPASAPAAAYPLARRRELPDPPARNRPG